MKDTSTAGLMVDTYREWFRLATEATRVPKRIRRKKFNRLNGQAEAEINRFASEVTDSGLEEKTKSFQLTPGDSLRFLGLTFKGIDTFFPEFDYENTLRIHFSHQLFPSNQFILGIQQRPYFNENNHGKRVCGYIVTRYGIYQREGGELRAYAEIDEVVTSFTNPFRILHAIELGLMNNTTQKFSEERREPLSRLVSGYLKDDPFLSGYERKPVTHLGPNFASISAGTFPAPLLEAGYCVTLSSGARLKVVNRADVLMVGSGFGLWGYSNKHPDSEKESHLNGDVPLAYLVNDGVIVNPNYYSNLPAIVTFRKRTKLDSESAAYGLSIALRHLNMSEIDVRYDKEIYGSNILGGTITLTLKSSDIYGKARVKGSKESILVNETVQKVDYVIGNL